MESKCEDETLRMRGINLNLLILRMLRHIFPCRDPYDVGVHGRGVMEHAMVFSTPDLSLSQISCIQGLSGALKFSQDLFILVLNFTKRWVFGLYTAER